MSDPREIDRLQGQIQELLEDLWQVPRFAGLHQGYRPAVDCYRTQEPPTLTVVADVAGVDPESLQIAVKERTLLISGERPRPRHERAVSYQQMEIEYGPFERKLSLPEPVQPEDANASYVNGFLRIVLPVADAPPPAPEPVRILIQVRRSW